jgi:hypothetical protein
LSAMSNFRSRATVFFAGAVTVVVILVALGLIPVGQQQAAPCGLS